MAGKPPFANIRSAPQDLEAEKALLGSVLMKSDNFHEVYDVVSAESFYSERHRLIFEAMREIASRSEPIDLLSVASQLESKNLLERTGGRAYLSELVDLVPVAQNARHYATLVHRKYMMRRLIEAAEHIGELGYGESENLEETLESAEHRLYELTQSGANTHKFFELKQMLGEAWERLERLHNSKEEIRGIKTGFKDIDDKLAGFQKADLIILAARPSMGKTALALDIARRTATEYGNPVCVFSLEMSGQQLVDRMLAAESRVDAWQLRTGRLSTDNDFDRLRTSLDRLSTAPIFIDDQPGNNVLKMRSVARRLKRERGLSLIIVDYLQLMTPINTRNSDSAVQQVTELSRSLKHLARDMDVPVLALSQLSRAVEQRGGKPRLSDLRDSGSIEQDADVVMFIHREEKYKDNPDPNRVGVAQILIEKHRNGPTGVVELYFDERKAAFLPIDKSGFGDFAPPPVPGGGDMPF